MSTLAIPRKFVKLYFLQGRLHVIADDGTAWYWGQGKWNQIDSLPSIVATCEAVQL